MGRRFQVFSFLADANGIIFTINEFSIRVFRQMGLEAKCIFEDYFMSVRGKAFDVLFLMKRLRVGMEDDFFYVF
jgi:hypothetical protein